MSLDSSVLADSLYTVFDSMSGSNSDFATGIAEAVLSYFETATATTEDTGTISEGEFVGTGENISIVGSSTSAASSILSACTTMNDMTSGGNAYLAEALASALVDMFNAATITCSVTGTVTLPNGSTSALTGTSSGEVVTTSATLESSLYEYFEDMNLETDETLEEWHERLADDVNEWLAEKMSDAITTCIESGTVSTDGTGDLEGSVGTGALT